MTIQVQTTKWPDSQSVDEKFRNEILVATVFKLKPGSTDKNDITSHIELKVFPYEVVCEDKQEDQKYHLSHVYHHMLLADYDIKKLDCENLTDFWITNKNQQWDKLPVDQQVFVKYRLEKSVGCSHFIRCCELQCDQCKKYYQCRFCHDEQEDHNFPKFDTKNVRCYYCHKEQPIAQHCKYCNVCFGEQWCPICKGFCSIGVESKPMYHCNGCNSCMTGVRRQWVHCNLCACCVRIDLIAKHKCLRFEGVCAICQSDVSDTIYSRTTLTCTHILHTHCYKGLLRQHMLKCPTCCRFMPVDDDRDFYLEHFNKKYQAQLQMPGASIVANHCFDCGLVFPHPETDYVKCICGLFNVEVARGRRFSEAEWQAFRAKNNLVLPVVGTVEVVTVELMKRHQIALSEVQVEQLVQSEQRLLKIVNMLNDGADKTSITMALALLDIGVVGNDIDDMM